MKLLTIYGSTRRNGNTEALAHKVLAELDTNQFNEVHLLNYHIKPIIDQRHTASGFSAVDDDYELLVKEMLNYEAILLVTPLYWYGMSGILKNFIDRWSQSLKSKEYAFKELMADKIMYIIVVGGKAAPLTALPLIQQFQLISQFFDMEFGGYIIGKGVRPLDVLDDEESIVYAQQFGKKIKEYLDNEGSVAKLL